MIKKVILNRQLFKTVYISFLLIAIIPFINGLAVTKCIIAFFTLWGVGLIIHDLVKNRLQSYKKRAFVPIFAFFCFCVLSYIINYENGLVRNIINLGIFFVFVAVFYITASDDPETLKNETVSVFKAYSIVNLILSLVSLSMYFAQIKIKFTGQEGISYRLGVWENRLFGVFSSSNVGGSIMAIGLVISVGLIIYLRKNGTLTRFWKIFLVISAVLDIWYIALSISRGTYVALAAAAVVFFVLYGYKPSKNAVLAFLKRFVCIVCAFALFYGMSAAMRQISFKTVQFLDSKGIIEIKVDGFDRIEYKDREQAVGQDDEENSINNLYEEDGSSLNNAQNSEKTAFEEKLSDISNKRFDIWKGALQISKNNRLFGLGRYYNEYLNHKDEIDWLTEDNHIYIVWSKGNAHNGYLQILVDIGILGLVCFITFLVWCLVKNLKAYSKADLKEKTALAVCLSAVCYVLVNNLFETNMALMSSNVIQASFWFIAGVCMSFSEIIIKRQKGE